jgi:hypothetical protein
MHVFHIPVNKETGKYKIEKYDSYEDTNSLPYFYVQNRYYTLEQDRHLWMIENQVYYWINFLGHANSDQPWLIMIDDKEKAMLYKLTWD